MPLGHSRTRPVCSYISASAQSWVDLGFSVLDSASCICRLRVAAHHLVSVRRSWRYLLLGSLHSMAKGRFAIGIAQATTFTCYCTSQSLQHATISSPHVLHPFDAVVTRIGRVASGQQEVQPVRVPSSRYHVFQQGVRSGLGVCFTCEAHEPF